jgi:prolyl 4-hydroxylase
MHHATAHPDHLMTHPGIQRFPSKALTLFMKRDFLDAGQCAAIIFAGIDPAHGEPIQGQRYDVGQEFKAHTDYFEPKGEDFAKFCAVAGQRTWTFMIYLNQPEAGGATRFKAVDKIIQPEQGKLLCWNNMDETGQPNPATMHHGMKVRKGVKYIITKWFRERPPAT